MIYVKLDHFDLNSCPLFSGSMLEVEGVYRWIVDVTS